MGNGLVFRNFDLHIGQGRNGVYPVSVTYSPSGETVTPTQVLIDQEPMRGWLENLQVGNIAGDALRALGRCLASFLLPMGPVRDLYQRSLGIIETGDSRLRLRLRISSPELARLPWEYAYDESSDDFLALNPRTVLVRYHSQPIPPRPIVRRVPVPMLVLVSNPPTVPALAAFKEVQTLIEALGHLLDSEQVKMKVLFSGPPDERLKIAALAEKQLGCQMLPGLASVDALRGELRRECRIIHYIGHGMFDERIGGALVLTDDAGDESLTTAQTLARELRSTGTALVVLNACQSATESTARSFVGLAPSLIHTGVPAVVAMQYAIADSSAMIFSRALYRALADGWPLDAAVTEGRKAISAQDAEGGVDWGIPVLFMRSRTGILWRQESAKMGEKTDASQAKTRIGDKIEIHARDIGAGAQVIGKQTQKWVSTQTPTEFGPSERAEISFLLAELKSQLTGLDIPENKRIVGQEFVGQLEEELTKTEEPPDASAIKVAGNWLLKNVPALTATLASLFASPIVGKVVETAGDIAADWVKLQFGGQA
jgi:hypothetical protein